MPREMITVFRAKTVEEADVVAAWLEENGIPAFVKNRHSTAYVPIVSTLRGVELCVADEPSAALARSLLAERQQELADRFRAQQDHPPITAFCEECGAPSTFPSTLAGTVQTCPFCRANMDVADESAAV